MSPKERIITPISEELTKFEPYFKKATKSDLPLLSTIINYNGGSATQTINICNLPAGVYGVSVTGLGVSLVERLLKE